MIHLRRAAVVVFVALSAVAADVSAQTLTARGFIDGRMIWYPQDAPNDAQNFVADLLARQELFATVRPWLQLAGGLDVRANSHDQVSSSWVPDFEDRGRLRSPLTVRRLSATVTHGPVTLDVGKQFIRWGKTDIVTPTDRLAPKDFIDVVNSEFLAVTGVRLTLQAGAETFEGAWVPHFTPSRNPLIDQRWSGIPAAGLDITIVDSGAIFPGGSQAAARWSHAGGGYECAAMFFDGFNHLPSAEVTALTLDSVSLVRRYPALRMYGGDVAVPTPWFTLKAEGGYFGAPDEDADNYILYVVQLERQSGEWLLTAGYAGEGVTADRPVAGFAPDRGMAKSIIGRASYTISPTRSAALEAAVRDNGDGLYMKGEYSLTRGQHWRTTMTGALLAGDEDDFIGQYHRNSHLSVAFRYSF